jgi:hypothetical protein
MQDLKPNEKRAKNAILLIQIMLALEIISIISDYFQYTLLQDVANGISPSEGAIYANDLRQRVIGIVHILMYIFSAVTFILWFRRAYFNLHIKTNPLEYDEAAAAYCWFIPFVSLYQPYKIMKELYIETDELLCRKKVINYTNMVSTSLLGWWWALWIINNTLGQIAFRTALKNDTVDKLIDSTEMSMLGEFVGIPLALITIKIIKDYASVEPLLFEVDKEDAKETVPA